MKKIAVITHYYKGLLEVLGQWTIKHSLLVQGQKDSGATPLGISGLPGNMEGSRNIQQFRIYTALNKIQS